MRGSLPAMETCEGLLLVPPDRGQILGRAIWKPRYVIVGPRNVQREALTNPTGPQTTGINRNGVPPKIQPRIPATDDYYITIFKPKDDWEASYQYSVSSVVDCQVQMLAHRKQGPVLPTLVITINDKEKKRRSSRAAGLISSKESTATTLWFRTPPDDHHISLHDWARFILSRKLPMSPESPASPSFTNPFTQQRSRDVDYFPRPPSGNPNPRTTLQHKNSVQTYSSRDRPTTYSSDSPSLRSKASDVSSPTSGNHPAHVGFAMPDPNKYTTVLPSDIPSPVATMSDYQRSELIEGWTVAQGRSSTVSSPIRGRGSVSSGGAQPFPGADSSSPPNQRETILDRAFQLRCIPGSERETPGEEKLTSLARFDALMREADQKIRQQAKEAHAEKMAMLSAFDEDDDSSEDETEEEDDEDDDDDEDHEEYAHEADVNGNRQTLIPPNAQRALEFLVSRRDDAMSPRSAVMRSSPANFSVPLQAPARPHTAHSKMHSSVAQRTTSQTQSMGQERLDVPISSSGKTSEDANFRANGEKRASGSSAKRLSFTEFTKRLSSTSSLLLVQTNTSGGSSRRSSEYDLSPSLAPKGTLNARGVPPKPHDVEREGQERHYGWRNSVGFTDGGLI
ncbi:uncharacterized protein GLRG_04850 [Colletotrichum graminicola M1.001]|uniref:CRIB domain-containing protein n=1 Tax=Colletotrichum graminicola (strain M1.001 / M2 / FGSC 10212) TaxID=645133 RepID=E3QGB0_COLGM|nr:uncharacterized protein GLRG_04850 [Colletotrichum graminicola M1.001]EFQ29706.1 hypothetical protein GLRG_04850 [Colletotrichum graminicola M1.001]